MFEIVSPDVDERSDPDPALLTDLLIAKEIATMLWRRLNLTHLAPVP
jgi:hypothetical protein